MKKDDLHYRTFKQGSKTYFNSSIFFPKAVRRDVFILYGFVRVADNFVDNIPQQKEKFLDFQARYLKAREGTPASDVIIDSFIELCQRKHLEEAWVDAFLHSMELDLFKNNYASLEETLEYIYGSAEVIGLFMARLLELDPASYPYAKMLGRSMQYINFLRDLDEDRRLGRTYLPLADSPFITLAEEETRCQPEEFRKFMQRNLKLYLGWQAEAEQGFSYIPRRYRIPIKTASDMYNWTARRIMADPFIVYSRQVKPSKGRILRRLLGNFFR